MSMGEQQVTHTVQGNSVVLEILDQAGGVDSAAGINEGEFTAAIDGVHIAIVIVSDGASLETTRDEVDAVGDSQSSRSFE